MGTIHTTLNAGPRDADTVRKSQFSHPLDHRPEFFHHQEYL